MSAAASMQAFDRVLFVHDGPLHTDSEGHALAVHFTRPLIERYRQLAPEVTFAMRTRPLEATAEPSIKKLEAEDFSWIAIPDPKSPTRYLRNAKRAKQLLAGAIRRHDVVVVRLPSTLGAWAFLEARRQNKPVLTEVVACAWDSAWHHGVLGKLLAPFFTARARYLIGRSEALVYVTSRFLQCRYPSRGAQISASNVELGRPDPAVVAAREQRIRQRHPESPIVLGTLGAIDVRYKDQELVIRALAAMRHARPTYRYVIAGGGNPDRLMRLVRRLGVVELVEFRGMVPQASVPALLDTIDIYVQPSRTEGLPRAVIEAMSRACPVLGSDAGGIPELLPADCVFGAGQMDKFIRLLEAMNPERELELARRNWEASEAFERGVLDARRAAFYRERIEAWHVQRGQ